MRMLLEWTLEVSIVLGLGLAAAAVFRARSAAFRHRVLAVALLVAIAMPLMAVVVPGWEVDAEAVGSVASFLPEATPSHVSVGAGAPAQTPVVGPDYGIPTASIAIAVWVLGVAISLSMPILGWIRLARLARGCRPIVDGTLPEITTRIAGTLGVSSSIRLLESSATPVLMTWGVVRPTIVLPSTAAGWSADRIHVVLAHELAHVRRRDWVLQMAVELLRGLQWFNPLAWILSRRMKIESEQASDDAVLNLGTPASEYASHLLGVARSLGATVTAGGLAMARPSTLERRVQAMLKPEFDRRAMSRPALAAAVVLFLGVAIPVAGLRAGAQEQVTGVTGTISDTTGALVPGVAVTLSNAALGVEVVRVSNEAGAYRLPEAQPGEGYTLEARLPGFQTARYEDLTLIAGQPVALDLILEVGGVFTALEVVAQRSASETPVAPPPQPERLRVSAGVSQGRLLTRVSPEYPPLQRQAGVEATVELEGRIGTDGVPTGLRLVRPVHSDFARAAINAVRQWRYSPAVLNGAPVEVPTTIIVEFSLND